jgi:uncharacterized protein (DUF1810 family)
MTPLVDLDRFIEAQDRVLDHVRAELAAGRKRSHWMWFVFPQLDGLARSETARFYALHSLDEARACWTAPRWSMRWRGAASTRSSAAPTT